MKKFTLILLTALLAPFAFAETLTCSVVSATEKACSSSTFSQLQSCSESSGCFGQRSDSDMPSADQFSMPETRKITQLLWSGSNDGKLFDVAFYADDDGKPGQVISTQSVTLTQPVQPCDVACTNAATTNNNNLLFRATLTTPVELQQGVNYWWLPIEKSANSNWSIQATKGAYTAQVNSVWMQTKQRAQADTAFQFITESIMAAGNGYTIGTDTVYQMHLRGVDYEDPSKCDWAAGQIGCADEWWNTPIPAGTQASPQSAKVIAYLNQAERCFLRDPTKCNEPNDSNEANGGWIGGGTVAENQEAVQRIDLGRDNRGEGYGNNIMWFLDAPSGGFQPYALRDGINNPWSGENYFPDENGGTYEHCDQVLFPVVGGGDGTQETQVARVQANRGPECGPNDDPRFAFGDCRAVVVGIGPGKVWEQYRSGGYGKPAGIDQFGTNNWMGGCTVEWDLTQKHDAQMRGWSTTSANAAGLPHVIFAITPGEIKKGVIKHVVGVTFPNEWKSPGQYVTAQGPNADLGGATHSSYATTVQHYSDKCTVSWEERLNDGTLVAQHSADECAEMPGWDSALHMQPHYGSVYRYTGPIDPTWPLFYRVVLTAARDYGVIDMDGTNGHTLWHTSNDFYDEEAWAGDYDLHPVGWELVVKLGWQNFELLSTYEDANGNYVYSMPGTSQPNPKPFERSSRYPNRVEF